MTDSPGVLQGQVAIKATDLPWLRTLALFDPFGKPCCHCASLSLSLSLSFSLARARALSLSLACVHIMHPVCFQL